ncbi:MAG: flippase [Anaerolineae bacterium]|nr:flippase [Anaerolineae bacterium]MCO5197445.1 flippase [Anaerolineae bacterium]MCO5205664.1 flippase [Anaerolineae bacterium]
MTEHNAEEMPPVADDVLSAETEATDSADTTSAPHKEEPSIRKRASRNVVFLGLSFFSQTVSQLLILSMIGRLAGAENAGIWAYVLVFTDPYAVFIDFGTTRMLVPEVARNRELADRLLGSALTLNILLGVPGLFILYFVANLQIFGLPSTTITAIGLTGLGLIFSTLILSIRSTFRAVDRFDLEAINSFVLALGLLIGAFISLWMNIPFIWFFFASTCAYFLVLLLSWVQYNRNIGRIRLNFEPKYVFGHVAAKSLTFMFINLLNRAYIRVDIFILGFFWEPVTVGYYALITNLFYRFDVITRLFMISILPSMSRAYVKNRVRVGFYLNQVLRLQFIVVVPVTVGGFFLASQLVALMYGSGYEQSVIFFRLLIIVLPLRFINRTFTITLAAMDLQRYSVYALAAAVVFNIALNFILIPQYAGLGATVTSMASEVLLFVLLYISIEAIVRKQLDWVGFARFVPGIVVLIPTSYFLQNWPWWLVLPLISVEYLFVLLIVRALSQSEMKFITRPMRRVRFISPVAQGHIERFMLARAYDRPN